MRPVSALDVQCDEHPTARPIGVPCAPGGTCCAHRHTRAALARIQQRAGKGEAAPYRGRWRDLPAEAEQRTAALDPGRAWSGVVGDEKGGES